jgi:DNA-binding transcriptional LysR family regulator
MDDELQRLERAFKATPDDEGAARAYQAALLRAGHRDKARETYAFKFRCPLKWSELEATDSDMRRYCKECQRQVHFVHSPAALRQFVADGECVAILPSREVKLVDALLDDPRLHAAEDPDAPCIVVLDAPTARAPRAGPLVMGAVRPVLPPPPAPPRPAGS